MGEIPVTVLRKHAEKLVDRVARGEEFTILRDGKPVARLQPTGAHALTAEALLAHWRLLPPVDYAAFRADLDGGLNSSF